LHAVFGHQHLIAALRKVFIQEQAKIRLVLSNEDTLARERY